MSGELLSVSPAEYEWGFGRDRLKTPRIPFINYSLTWDLLSMCFRAGGVSLVGVTGSGVTEGGARRGRVQSGSERESFKAGSVVGTTPCLISKVSKWFKLLERTWKSTQREKLSDLNVFFRESIWFISASFNMASLNIKLITSESIVLPYQTFCNVNTNDGFQCDRIYIGGAKNTFQRPIKNEANYKTDWRLFFKFNAPFCTKTYKSFDLLKLK